MAPAEVPMAPPDSLFSTFWGSVWASVAYLFPLLLGEARKQTEVTPPPTSPPVGPLSIRQQIRSKNFEEGGGMFVSQYVRIIDVKTEVRKERRSRRKSLHPRLRV